MKLSWSRSLKEKHLQLKVVFGLEKKLNQLKSLPYVHAKEGWAILLQL